MEGPPELTEVYDQALLGMLQHAGRVETFLEAMFGFLYRKTDFYRLQRHRGDRLGFPPGGAARIALQAFKKFEHFAIQDHERRLRDLEEKLKKEKTEEERTCAPPSIQEVEVGSTGEETPGAAEREAGGGGAAAAAGEEEEEEEEEEGGAGASAQPSASSDEQLEGATALDIKQEPAEATEKLGAVEENSDCYNGAVRDNYSWSQDYTDLEVKVPVSKTTVKGKQVSVDIQSSSLRVSVFEGASERVLIDGKLTHKVNTENSLWSLEPGRCISISLSKNGEYWWNAILEGEETIDIEKINKERSMATVDEEEHAVLDRLTFDYHQKMQGKPQSHEMKVHEMLKKGWDAEGSPFKGQKFDPTMFNISPGAVQF